MLCKICSSKFLDDEESLARWLALGGSVGLAPQPAVQGSRPPVLDNNGEVIGQRGIPNSIPSISDQRSRDLVAHRLALPYREKSGRKAEFDIRR
jgi:hypothetical protein